MNCTVCGAMIPNGQTTCPSCGNSAATSSNGQPVQPMGDYRQPVQQGQPMGGYQQSGIMKLLALIGGLFITLAPFFSWCSIKLKFDGEKFKKTSNLFGLVKGYGLGNVFFAISAIIMILCGVALIAEALKDINPAVQSILNKNQYMQYFGIGLVAVVLLFWLLSFFNGDLTDCIDAIKKVLKYEQTLDAAAKGHVNRGFGPILSMAGILCSAFPRVMQLLKKTNY